MSQRNYALFPLHRDQYKFMNQDKSVTHTMSSNSVTDLWGWIVSLPPVSQWNTDDAQCFCIYRAEPSQPSLNLRVIRNLHCHNPNVSFSLTADFNASISLWSTNPLYLKSITDKSFDPEYLKHLLCGIIHGVLKYGPNKKPSIGIPGLLIDKYFRDIFNLAFLTLALLVCIYEAPQNLRWRSVEELRCKLSSRSSQEAMRQLVRILGSNLEEKWMRSVNLAITNWNFENRSFHQSLNTPLALFSYSLSTTGLWKVQLYCPITAMMANGPENVTHDRRLLFSLNYQQFEGVIQFTYKLIFREYWIDVIVKVDNIRCDVIQLVSEKLMANQGYGSEEKHFPSRVSLQLNPTLQSDVLSVSVSKSSDNPIHEVALEKGIESTFEPPGPYLGLKVSASETVTMAIKPWKFEQSFFGDSALLSWFLHDGVNEREVFSSTRPTKMALFRPRSWFRNRYSSAYRPFTRQGGVIFAGDEYGESVWWKVCSGAEGKTMEWEISGRVWLTYWPNKCRTFYTETRMLEFKELLHITLSK